MLRKIMQVSLLVLSAAPAAAQNVDLSTLPRRASVQLTIYNSADLTLVRETRRLTFKEGSNRLQFSWQNTRIDPSSVELRFLSRPADLELVDTTFPHDKPHLLYWNVLAEAPGDALVEVSYFTSGISWAADYVLIAGEADLSLESYVRIVNGSGEDYEDAEVRLVVGQLNLVQRIADLAGMAPSAVGTLDARRAKALEQRAARALMAPADEMTEDLSFGDGRPKSVRREALSEYYLFSIEGRETVPTGWSKRLRSFAAPAVPYALEHRYRPQQYGDHLERVLVADNDADSGLGKGPLPDGMVRVFRRAPGGGLAYVGAHATKYVPKGEALEVRLGPDPDVVFERVLEHAARSDFEFSHAQVVGWDEVLTYRRRVQNFSARPLSIEIRERFTGDVSFVSAVPATRHDAHTARLAVRVKPKETVELPYQVVRRQGRRAKSSELRLEGAATRAP